MQENWARSEWRSGCGAHFEASGPHEPCWALSGGDLCVHDTRKSWDRRPLRRVDGIADVLQDKEKPGGGAGVGSGAAPSAQLNGAWLISLSNETSAEAMHLGYSAFR